MGDLMAGWWRSAGVLRDLSCLSPINCTAKAAYFYFFLKNCFVLLFIIFIFLVVCCSRGWVYLFCSLIWFLSLFHSTNIVFFIVCVLCEYIYIYIYLSRYGLVWCGAYIHPHSIVFSNIDPKCFSYELY